MQVVYKILIGILVLLVMIAVISMISKIVFNQKVKKELELLTENLVLEDQIITLEDLEDLPEPVNRWLRYSGVVGKTDIKLITMHQNISMRLGVDKPWMNASANQYVTTDNPGFIWHVNINMAPLIHISGRDKYIDGHGEMLIKVMSLMKVADSKGPKIDQGTLLRYLAEICWVPTAALKDYITWEAVDDYHAKAIMTYEDVSAEGIFEFDDEGKVTSFEAMRYGEFEGTYQLENWKVEVSDYLEFSGYMLPTKGDITWELAEGDYHWYTFEVISVKVNERV